MYVYLWICKLTTTGCGIMLLIHQYCRNHSILPVVWAAGLNFMIRRKTDTRFPERRLTNFVLRGWSLGLMGRP